MDGQLLPDQRPDRGTDPNVIDARVREDADDLLALLAPGEPVLVFLWEGVTGEILDVTARCPRSTWFTFAGRIDRIVLDILDRLPEAGYAPVQRRRALLADAGARLVRLRVLWRLAHARRLVDSGTLRRIARAVDEAGRRVGGWRQHLDVVG